MIRTNKKSDRSVEVADPDFGGAGVEVESAFLVDLGWGVRWGRVCMATANVHYIEKDGGNFKRAFGSEIPSKLCNGAEGRLT